MIVAIKKESSMEIQLSKGAVAIVDDDDYDWLQQWKWYLHPGGYAQRITYDKGSKSSVLMHRAILERRGINLSGLFVDHANRDKSDNRKSNLRTCTPGQSVQNRARPKHNKSGFKGVDWVKKDRRFRAKIGVNGVTTTLGYYKSAIEAARSYNAAAVQYHGEFAVLNDIPAIDTKKAGGA